MKSEKSGEEESVNILFIYIDYISHIKTRIVLYEILLYLR